MALVFIHGVANRKGVGGYEDNVKTRNLLFNRYLYANKPAAGLNDPLNPYWGGNASTLRWGGASIKGKGASPLGTKDAPTDLAALYLAGIDLKPDRTKIILTIARVHSLSAAMDALWYATWSESSDADRLALVELSKRAYAYEQGLKGASPPWLATVKTDDEFLQQLKAAVGAMPAVPGAAVTMGVMDKIWDKLSEAKDRIFAGPGQLGSAALLALTGESARMAAATFFGDAFVYFQQRGTKENPGPIPTIVIDALHQARAATPTGENMIAVGHSMGGIILYDVLTSFVPDFKVEVVVTGGSQFAVVEELKLFLASDPNIPGPALAKAPRPAKVDRWLNIYDTNDPVGFSADGVFEGIEDFEYSTGKSLLQAHGAYFLRPSFHQRLAVRLGMGQ
jgi:hypothetical protein